MQRLPLLDSPLPLYERQAAMLFDSWRAGDTQALEFFHRHHPRWLDQNVPWLPKRLAPEELRAAAFEPVDAQLALARWYDFAGWPALVEFAQAIAQRDPAVYPFECAVEALIAGDRRTLGNLLGEQPDLLHARSTRVTHFDPPVHAATLLHYIAANGVEGYRQRSPPNAVEVARLLLEYGAEVDSLAHLYGGDCTTMSLLVSSSHPAEAGVQVPLIDLLVDYGATLEPLGQGNWTSPLETALVFGYRDAALALQRRGAPVRTAAAAAGLGLVERLTELLPAATPLDRHRGLAIAAQHGEVETMRLLLDAGEDPNRFNPPGTHAHSTPLHQAAHAGHLLMVQLLVERGARRDLTDTIYRSTALGWAEHGERTAVAEYLRSL